MMEKDLAIFNYCALSSKLHLVFNTLILDQTESDVSQAPFSCVLMDGLRRAVFCMYRHISVLLYEHIGFIPQMFW